MLKCGPVLSAEVQPANSAGPEQEKTYDTFIPDIFSFRYGRFRPRVDLNGTWEFKIDKDGVGTTERWHAGQGGFDHTIKIPGVPQAQGLGVPNRRQKNQFLDPFWVRRKFQMPGLASDKRVWLRLGGVLPAAAVYLNGAYVGYTKSSRTQQRVDVTKFVKPGMENLIVLGQAANAGRVIGDAVFLRIKPASFAPIPAATKLVVADRVDQALADYIQAGGKCLLLSQGAVIEQDKIYYPGMPNFYTYYRALPWNAGPGNAGSVILTATAIWISSSSLITTTRPVWKSC